MIVFVFTTILIIMVILIYRYNFLEKYENCTKDSCNIDVYNIKHLPDLPQLYSHEKVDYNSMVNDNMVDNTVDDIDKYNNKFYNTYNLINNSSSAHFDPVDVINYNDIYTSTTVADIYDQITKN